MQRNGGYTLSTHTVTFRADGRFELVNMPDWCLNFGKSSQGFLSGSGTWKISQDADHWVIYLFFDRTSGAAGLPGQMFIEGWRPRAIFEYIGDPDEGHAMRYEKTI